MLSFQFDGHNNELLDPGMGNLVQRYDIIIQKFWVKYCLNLKNWKNDSVKL